MTAELSCWSAAIASGVYVGDVPARHAPLRPVTPWWTIVARADEFTWAELIGHRHPKSRLDQPQRE
ncbi:hypothetical protein [Saccharopolyspora phatthalungensis]|uniref:Uncharacterized protein n=1 Tax=Saccharopolyspora phatthalungensis TaxID=664693 RepID=A0A840Q2U6_9PSEU|nr:hypothetical protein [Saccharopolyspora phatthalungensis]MBB5154250.1 hypothetical protein [Saccharopolyspora phatthalungensis]